MRNLGFDALRLRSLVELYLAGNAALAFGAGNTSTWILPHDEGSPIQLRLEEDACVVLAGFSFRVTISAGETGSEWMVLDCLEAIVSGRASEHYDFSSNLLGDERSDGVIGASFSGRDLGMVTESSDTIVTRRIPAWETVPERPAETTMEGMWLS